MSEGVLEVRFPVQGSVLFEDHGYCLYSALKQYAPDLTQAGWQVAPIRGKREGRLITIHRSAELLIRAPGPQLGRVLGLAGKGLRVGDWHIGLGDPVVRELEPSSHLEARCVLYRSGATAPQGKKGTDWATTLGLELGRLLTCPQNPRVTIGARRLLHVKGNPYWGYGLEVHNLTDQDSLTLQAHGLGGKLTMGAGVMVHG